MRLFTKTSLAAIGLTLLSAPAMAQYYDRYDAPRDDARYIAEQPVESGLISTVWRSGQENEMALLILGKPFEQFKPLLPALMRTDARMCLIDNNGLGTGSCKAVAPLVCLDVVQAHDREGMRVEERLRRG